MAKKLPAKYETKVMPLILLILLPIVKRLTKLIVE